MDGKFCAWVHGAQCSQGAAVSPRRIKLMSQELFVILLQGGFLLRTSAPGPSKTRISFSNHPYVAPPAAAASEAALLFPYTCSSIAKRDSKVRLRHASHQSITSLSPNYILPSHYSSFWRWVISDFVEQKFLRLVQAYQVIEVSPLMFL